MKLHPSKVNISIQESTPDERLNEPPKHSPGLSVAMPWVNTAQTIPRPERAQEA